MLNSPAASAEERGYLEREGNFIFYLIFHYILYFIICFIIICFIIFYIFHLSLLVLGYLETWKEKKAARENPAEQEMHLLVDHSTYLHLDFYLLSTYKEKDIAG